MIFLDCRDGPVHPVCLSGTCRREIHKQIHKHSSNAGVKQAWFQAGVHQFVQSAVGVRRALTARLGLTPPGASHRGPLLPTRLSSLCAHTRTLALRVEKHSLPRRSGDTREQRDSRSGFQQVPRACFSLGSAVQVLPAAGSAVPRRSGPLSRLEGWHCLVRHLRQVVGGRAGYLIFPWRHFPIC